ncbi:glycosyltransferase family 4 protein [Patescibacteria group bacterium]|nr:glycosyltransferase family 4 protein [Patescibacteria group bacterium]
MKILRIIYDWPPPWHGLAPHPYELTESQVRAGHEVEVFCGRWPHAGEIERPGNIKVNPIMREPLPGTIFFTSSVVLFFKYLSWRRKNSPDIIHSHGHFAVWIYLYRFFLQKFFPWAKELKVPLVVHFHNVAKDRWVQMEIQDKPISPLARYLIWPFSIFSDKNAVKSAAACIFVSEGNLKKAVEYYGADERRCFFVESGVNPDLFTSVSPDEIDKSRLDIGFDTDDRVILNHGIMSERKNVHLLVEALKFLPKKYKLFLVGSGDSTYMGKISETIKISGLSDRVIATGYTPYPETPIAYQVSDLFVLPSSWEGLPKVVMQGLACGVPCLVSGFKLSEDIEGLYYLENLDPGYIANYIYTIVESGKKFVDSEKVAHSYSWDSRIKEIEKVYEFAKQNYLL